MTYDDTCVACESAKSRQGYQRCWDCWEDWHNAYEGRITDEEYRSRCTTRRLRARVKAANIQIPGVTMPHKLRESTSEADAEHAAWLLLE